ncbi:stressosome-associated protein Prli42 [Virgibacillus phasianinus]|nr:stressosome-associated protein Prli42 [Virgibacillus phasianinus]
MSNNHAKTHTPRKASKRDRRLKIVIYIMIIAMLLTVFTTGLSLFVN